MTTNDNGELSPTTRTAVLKALLDEVKAAYDRSRAGADDAMRDLYEAVGVTAVEVRVPGCPGPVARLTLSPAEPAVAVDQAGLLAWCRDRYPTEVATETVVREEVRAPFVAVLMARLKVDEEGKVIDPDTGELIPWARPVPPGPPRTTLRFVPHGRADVAAAWASGRLGLPSMLALPPGGPEEGSPDGR